MRPSSRAASVSNGRAAGAYRARSPYGLEGLIVRRKKGIRFMISLELIQRSVAVEIEAADLEHV